MLLDLADLRMPCPDARFDIVFADKVVEHLVNPSATLVEVRRVMMFELERPA